MQNEYTSQNNNLILNNIIFQSQVATLFELNKSLQNSLKFPYSVQFCIMYVYRDLA